MPAWAWILIAVAALIVLAAVVYFVWMYLDYRGFADTDL